MSAGTWWDQIGAYKNAIFPMQIIIMIIAVVVTHFSFTKPDTKTSNMTKAYLSFTLAWDILANKTQFRLPDVQWQRAKCFSYQEFLL